MNKRDILRPFCSCLMAFITMTTCAVPTVKAAPEMTAEQDQKMIPIPYNTTDAQAKAYEYLYVVGGYHSVDNGCPAWGTADSRNARIIGDTMGYVTVTYTDGTVQEIPLVFGYTLWYYNNWQETSAPFKSGHYDKELVTLLRSTLSLKGAFEGDETCVFRVRLSAKPVRSVEMRDNPDKEGTPVLKGGFLTTGTAGVLTLPSFTFDAADSFFDTHTVDGDHPFPQSVRDALDTINHALMTYEEDFQSAPVFAYPEEYTGSRVYFTGSPLADIATASIYYNVKSLCDRVDADGMLHTSYKDAPSWRYDGFGYWVERASSYYTSYYSRDGGRALMTLNQYGYTTAAERAVLYANRQMMYFPENRLTIGGVDIPGHYTVVVNQPMLYSTVLVPHAGWATRYTKEKFGDEYQNLGNQETDGHGLMMLANYATWRNLGSTAAWVEENWSTVREAPAWILWCFEHPDLSFAKDGLLYAESEAGMMQYTLYCNVPCMLGMYGYAHMAEAAGHTAEATQWRACADAMKAAIEKRFLRTRTTTWNSTGFGFFHDPVITMLADVYGYDLDAYPEAFAEWVKASRNTYAADVTTVSAYDYYGASGIGYNHSMITQNALLTDNMSDATKLTENLCRISYAPRLPDPYIIPEGITYDNTSGAVRRQGDLGNLVQVAEAMKCFDIVKGIGAVSDGVLKILPRLPENWCMEVYDHEVQYSGAKADVCVTYPKDGVQIASVTLHDSADVHEISFRFGPLPADTKYAAVSVNGENVPCSFSLTGDSAWVNVTFANTDGVENQLVLIYSRTLDELGGFPETGMEDTTETIETTEAGTEAATESPTAPGESAQTAHESDTGSPERKNPAAVALPVAVSIAVAALIAVGVAVLGRRKKKGSS